ncbi:putative RNA-dependent RNA polymerase [Pepper cryptic virus 2]|uniref:Putative RNA-dependent RNA polymerase n=1 Tax=Pepper cryptic virus 2 TaxID=1050903 RepID=A0A1J1DT58_9VIRU|nr:putative RNA-dependent RNA polymerase [Pepper cryptic virus 2]
MAIYRMLNGYAFTAFGNDLEKLDQRHIHRIRREEATTYRDEFALKELMDLNPILYEQFLEGWSRSYYEGSKHLQAIIQYGIPDPHPNLIDKEIYNKAGYVVLESLGSLPRVRAFDVLTELDSVHYEQSSSAGCDYHGPKGPIQGENHIRAITRAKATLWSAIKDEGEGIEHVIRSSVPDVGYTRTQLTDLYEKTKIRGVWGRAFHYILLEGTVANPLLDVFKRGGTFYHIGENPQYSVPDILSQVSECCKYLVAIDWSNFDATVARFEINMAFDLIKTLIMFPNIETELCFEICRQLFIHKKIAAPDGNIYWSHKGIPSGSYFTSIIGSIVNRLRVEYIFRKAYGVGPKMCYTQGDDSLIGADFRVDPDRLSEIAAPLDWKLNPAKTDVSLYPENVTFLGRTMYGGINQRDLKRCLRLLIFPEFPVPSGEISAYRAVSIAQDAGGTSEVLNSIAKRLRRQYGVAEEHTVPKHFELYVP